VVRRTGARPGPGIATVTLVYLLLTRPPRGAADDMPEIAVHEGHTPAAFAEAD